MKQLYAIKIVHPRCQVDQVYPEKTQLFEKYRGDPDIAHIDVRGFTILIRRRDLKLISDGVKINEVKVNNMAIINLKNFTKKYKLKESILDKSELKRNV